MTEEQKDQRNQDTENKSTQEANRTANPNMVNKSDNNSSSKSMNSDQGKESIRGNSNHQDLQKAGQSQSDLTVEGQKNKNTSSPFGKVNTNTEDKDSDVLDEKSDLDKKKEADLKNKNIASDKKNSVNSNH